jgi:hypothetical protein
VSRGESEGRVVVLVCGLGFGSRRVRRSAWIWIGAVGVEDLGLSWIWIVERSAIWFPASRAFGDLVPGELGGRRGFGLGLSA